MTYGSGGLIEAVDYNNFAQRINWLIGTGSGAPSLDYGWGQTGINLSSNLVLANVAASNTVTAAQWATLISRLDTIDQHETATTSGITQPTAGNTITYISTIDSLISTLTTNRRNMHTGINSVVGQVNGTQFGNTTVWTTTCTKTARISFASADQMRYFFNAGGYISFTVENSALAGNTKSTDWDALLDACGVVRIRAHDSDRINNTGTASVYNTNAGFYDLTAASYTTILRQYSTNAVGGYNLNYATFDAILNAAPGSATAIDLRFTGTDASLDTSTPASQDRVTGNVIFQWSAVPPSTVYIGNSWGAITFTAITNTQG
jgi:hypothetical protein